MPHYSRRSRSRSRSHHRRQHGQASKSRHDYYEHYRRSPRRQTRNQADLKSKKRNTSQYKSKKRYSSRYSRSSSSSSSSSQSSYSDSSQSRSRRSRQYNKHRPHNKYHKPQYRQEKYSHRHDKPEVKEKRYQGTDHHRDRKKYQHKNPSTPSYIDPKYAQREPSRKNYDKSNYDKNYSKQTNEPRHYKPHSTTQNQQGHPYKSYASSHEQQNHRKPQLKPIQKEVQKEHSVHNEAKVLQKKPVQKQVSVEVSAKKDMKDEQKAVFIKRTEQAQDKWIPKKQKIPEIQQILCKAKQNLQVKPLQPNFMILDSFKTMNHIKAEALDSVLSNSLKQTVQRDYETKKAQVFGKEIEILPEMSAPIVHINQQQSQTEKKMVQSLEALKGNTAALSQMFRQLLLAQ